MFVSRDSLAQVKLRVISLIDVQLMLREESVTPTVFYVTAGRLAGLCERLVEADAKVEACTFPITDDCTYHRVFENRAFIKR